MNIALHLDRQFRPSLLSIPVHSVNCIYSALVMLSLALPLPFDAFVALTQQNLCGLLIVDWAHFV